MAYLFIFHDLGDTWMWIKEISLLSVPITRHVSLEAVGDWQHMILSGGESSRFCTFKALIAFLTSEFITQRSHGKYLRQKAKK
jgi:hypothetical protein